VAQCHRSKVTAEEDDRRMCGQRKGRPNNQKEQDDPKTVSKFS